MDFFAVKKLVSYLISPVPLGILTLTLALVAVWLNKSSNWVRWPTTLAWLLLVVVPMSPLSSEWLEEYERLYPSYEPQDVRPVKQIIVLACYVSDDPALPVTSQHHACSRGRLLEALRIWHLHPSAQILLSGGSMRFGQMTMAQRGADFLSVLGVPQSQLKVIGKGRDTNSEVLAIKSELNPSTPILVTSATHMKRAVRLFARHGVSVTPAPAEHLILYSNHIERELDWRGYMPTAADYYRSERAWYAILANMLVTLQSLWGDDDEDSFSDLTVEANGEPESEPSLQPLTEAERQQAAEQE